MDASFHAVSSANPPIPQLPFVIANVFVPCRQSADAPNERIDPERGFWFLLAKQLFPHRQAMPEPEDLLDGQHERP
ncbi:MAG: hypothetical protein ABL311_05695 [Nitratireductor rhodophyticola]|uniref:hypothetical protein n=1 Tax=Nitratireductor rhodophyticola TaxID=2854036 RepID=UPI002EB2A6EC|nr:hypothetical protein [Pseudomonadota bacterium]